MFTPTQKVTHMHSFTPTPLSHTPDANKYTHTQTLKKNGTGEGRALCVHTLE